MNYPVYTSMPYPVQQQMQQRQDMQNQQLMQQQMTQQVQQQLVLSPASRVVVSREEAIATPADFSGALMVFPDITNNCVYIKRWNIQSGAAACGSSSARAAGSTTGAAGFCQCAGF